MDSSKQPIHWFWPAAPWSSFLQPLGSLGRVWCGVVGWGVWMLPKAENYAMFPADLLLV